LSDLSPLEGLKLTYLNCTYTQVSGLSPLKGLRLTTLHCSYTQVSDLSPLQGAPLTFLDCSRTLVTNFAPLQGMPLTDLLCGGTQVSDLSPLHECKDLKYVAANSTKVTPAQVAALQKALPNCKIEWDGGTSASPAGEGAKPNTPQPAAAGNK
jgi:Leucine-rich repeat (LRR) protein